MTLNCESVRIRRGWARSIRADVLRRMALAPTHSDASFGRSNSGSAPHLRSCKKYNFRGQECDRRPDHQAGVEVRDARRGAYAVRRALHGDLKSSLSPCSS